MENTTCIVLDPFHLDIDLFHIQSSPYVDHGGIEFEQMGCRHLSSNVQVDMHYKQCFLHHSYSVHHCI